LKDVVSSADDGALDHDEVSGDFGCAPFLGAGFFGPLLCRYSVSGAQKCRLRFVQFRADGREVQRDLTLGVPF
jgi:hypothetical protein